MKNSIQFSFLITILCFFFACQKEKIDAPQMGSLTQYVNPFMGTANHGHVYPGATVPFGMVQLSPDNGTQAWDWCSGYNWVDDTIVGFSHTHLSGTGIGDLYDISFMPTQEKIDFTKKIIPRNNVYAAKFSHDNESAVPGYYQVKLDNGIEVELTTTERVGFHNYHFPEGKEATLLIDLGFAINWDKPTATAFQIDQKKNIVTGYRHSTGWAKDQRLFFAAEFSTPIQSFQLADDTELIQNKTIAEGVFLRTQLNFGKAKKVQVKVGLSSASKEGAIAALAEIPAWDFDKIKTAANTKWEKELSKIKIKTPNEELKKIFYTSLYRTCLAPVLMSDAQGNYKGVDGENHQAKDFTKYGIFSLWDTFRAADPLYTITQRDKVNDFVRSMLSHYEEYGLLPVWSLLGNETNTMTGYHAIPVLVDAYQKGFRQYDVEKAYTAMKKSAMQDIRGSDFYRQYQYIPFDKAGESVTRTLEYAYDDWCIAQMAKALGKKEDYIKFTKRSEYFKNVFDASTGFMRGKDSKGKWITPFDPQYSEHNPEKAIYTEGNAWQHSWFVPHAPEELIHLIGGKETFVQKLDALFTTNSELRGENVSVDISGLIGQYAHGNEPSHHIAYFYNFADQAWKTQKIVREIMSTQYNATPTGLCGNEDCGQMSAWYVFSAMGFYPFNPADGKYAFGSPLFEKIEIPLDKNKTFTLLANNVSSDNKYIQSIKWNDQPYDKMYLTHEALMSGGTLEFEMGKDPFLE